MHNLTRNLFLSTSHATQKPCRSPAGVFTQTLTDPNTHRTQPWPHAIYTRCPLHMPSTEEAVFMSQQLPFPTLCCIAQGFSAQSLHLITYTLTSTRCDQCAPMNYDPMHTELWHPEDQLQGFNQIATQGVRADHARESFQMHRARIHTRTAYRRCYGTPYVRTVLLPAHATASAALAQITSLITRNKTCPQARKNRRESKHSATTDALHAAGQRAGVGVTGAPATTKEAIRSQQQQSLDRETTRVLPTGKCVLKFGFPK